MKHVRCQVEQVIPFNDAVYQVLLRPEEPLNHKAGQYLLILMNENDKRAFSIASPEGAELIELHIGASVTESYPMQVVEHLRNAKFVDIEAPAGKAWFKQDSHRPRLMIAGGSGFSYIKSLVEQQIQAEQQIPTTLYWGCRHPDAMYAEHLARRWHQEYPWLTFVPVVEECPVGWDGKQNKLLAQVEQDFTSLQGYDIYIAGRFAMVGAALSIFQKLDAEEDHLYGDAFGFIKSAQ